VTTLLDADLYSAEEIANLFAERWHCELAGTVGRGFLRATLSGVTPVPTAPAP
jgi:hypothetical protein